MALPAGRRQPMAAAPARPARREGEGRRLAARVRGGAVSAREVVEDRLARADALAHLGALWHVDREGARAAAVAIDARVRRGEDPGPLAGVPVVVKDGFAVRGLPRDGGGTRREVSSTDADAVARLRAAGAVVLGTAAMHQLAFGTTGQTPGRPVVRNPRDPRRHPGGSSSGSAVTVAAGIVPLALGSDSAGSVRVPAAWCGVVGVKPARADLSREGLLPLAPTLDAAGWIAASVDDALLAGDVLAPAATPRPAAVEGLRVAVDPAALAACEPDVAVACRRGLDALAAAGAVVRERPAGLPAPRVGALYAAELAAAWGERIDLADEAVGEDVRRGIEHGRTLTGAEVADLREACARARASATLDADVLATPTVPVVAPPLHRPDDVRTATRFTRAMNVVDWPAITVPCPTPGLPAGLQLAAPRGREAALWGLALAIERGTGA